VRGAPTNRTRGVILALCAMMLTTTLFLSLLALLSGPGSATGAQVDQLWEQEPVGFSRESPAPLPRQALAETPPADTSIRLTVPEMKRVRDVPVETAPASEEAALRDGALHVEGTGFPGERDSNVYIAGHRQGFPGTRSHLIFWDLPALEKGDRVILEDSRGWTYEYAVFRELVVSRQEVHVTQPVPGKKSVVSLQTCTLPHYAKRLVVQAELVAHDDLSGGFGLPGAW
jgi:sortase A